MTGFRFSGSELIAMKAGGAIIKNSIVKVGANDGEVLQAAAATDSIVGVYVGPADAAQGDFVDIAIGGIAEVLFSGIVNRGGPVTTDGAGKAVAAAPSAGTNNRIIGFAKDTTAANDIATVIVNPSFMQG